MARLTIRPSQEEDRFVKLGLVVAAVLLLVPLRGQAASIDAGTVQIGRSIGAIRLGMTSDDVTTTYGAPRATSMWRLSGKSGTVLEYARYGGRVRIFFDGRFVVSVETTSPHYRLPGGIRVGTVTPRRPNEFFRWRGFRYESCGGMYSRKAYRADTELVLPFGPRTGRRVIAVSVTKLSFRLLAPGAARCD
jgi:hypothetical protein